MANPPAPALEPPCRCSASAGLNHNNNNSQPPPPPEQQPPLPPPPPPLPPGVRKSGYLRKHNKHGHKRFFVLRAPSGGAGGSLEGSAAGQPARLEYYESEKKWRGKAAAAAAAAAPKRVLALDACLTVHKRADARHKHLLALYTRDEYWALAAENEQEQEAWYQAVTELLREGQAAGPGSPPAPGEDLLGYGPAGGVGGGPYREVWQVTLKPKGLGQSRSLTGVHRLCLTARTVGLVRLNCERPSVTLQLMSIRRCGHSDSFFFMELGRSAATGPGELWMQADDAVVAQNIHETILEAMKALRELAEFRPRSKSQSSSSSSGGAAAAGAAGGSGGGGGGLSFMCSRPISVPGPRRHHHHLHPLPPSQTGLLRRSRTDILAAAAAAGSSGSSSSSGSSRARTTSEGDGFRAGSLSGSPMSPDAVQTPAGRSHTLAAACCPPATQSGRSLALGHSPSLLCKLAIEPVGQQPSSCGASASGSPSDPAGFMALEELGSSPAGDPQPFSSSLTTSSSNPSNTPETPPGQDLDSYMAMERGHLCYRPCLCESAGGDKAPRKRTYSLTMPAHHCLVPLSSASLDEYTLMRATLPTKASSSPFPRMTSLPYREDYCDIDIGSGDTSSSSSSHLGQSGTKEEDYMPMAPKTVSSLPAQDGRDSYLSLSPTGVSPPGQVLHPLPYRISSESSSDDSGYMHMWGIGTRPSGESPEGRSASDGDYINMSPLLFPPFGGPSSASSDSDSFRDHREQSNCFCSSSHAYWSHPNALGERKNSNQYVLMSSPGGRLNHVPKAECHHTTMPLPMRHSRTECFHSQQECNDQMSHHSLGLLLPSMDEPSTSNEPQSPSGEYVNISYSQAPPCQSSTFLLGSSSGGHSSFQNSKYTNIKSDGSSSGAISMGSLEEVLLSEACPSPGQSDKPYVKVGVQQTCLSNPLSEAGDYTAMFFATATAPPQLISHKAETVRVSSPVAGLKRLTLSGMETFIFASPPSDPNQGAKVIRADPQGRRRHSSETFSSTTTVTPVSPSFAHSPKRHNSASVENVSLRKNEGLVEEQNSSPMCRETSAGFQHGLNHIAVDALEGDHLASAYQGKHKGRHPLNGSIDGTYTTIDFQTRNLNEASSVKVC